MSDEIASLIERAMTRRRFVRGSVGTLAGAFTLPLASCAGSSNPLRREPAFPLAFRAVPNSTEDSVVVPDGYAYDVFLPWGQPLQQDGPAWSVSSSAEDQQRQVGMHNDGMHFFPIGDSPVHGYLVVNHEYTDEGLLHADGTANWSAEKVRKSQAAHGVSIAEVRWDDGARRWTVVDGWRVTASSEIELAGPLRGHPLMRTGGAGDTAGERAGTSMFGTLANCAGGATPWGTFLTCEENFQDYFSRTEAQTDARRERYGIGAPNLIRDGWRSTYGWDAFDARFDADRPEYRNHAHRFGWVVEIDPARPDRRPAKRTALGRCRHENAAVVVAPDGRVVVYMGDDARFEYIYKFVSAKPMRSSLDADASSDANWGLLDEGTLYAARFEDGEAGRWLPLTLDNPDPAARARLRAEFASDEEILVFARRAADLVGATKMDRPEWIAVDQDPETRRVRQAYVTLTNNSKRGRPGREGPNAANPRVENVFGHVLQWREADGDPTADSFRWNPFIVCGQRDHADAHRRGAIRDGADTSQDFGSPDGLAVDASGDATVLWIQTDVSASKIGRKDYAGIGNNQMFAADPATGRVRRFLTGPKGCEVTGFALTSDRRHLFVNIQHPGEVSDVFSDPSDPLAVSRWPNGERDGRPRSATIAIRREDGGPIGS